jgi:predicted AlkP superfamily pyrophosphatase or phosphodiesterase
MRRTSVLLTTAALGAALLAASGQPGAAGAPSAGAARAGGPPDRVVVIVVDGLSRQLVRRYDMDNVKRLMRHGVNSPRGYLGHTSAVTVVTHNVLTSGQLPKHMGWTDEGYRDVDGVLTEFASDPANPFWITSELGSDEMFALQEHAGYPKLADYLHAARPGSKVVTISPKTYAAWGLGGSGSDSIVTFSSRNFDCDGDGELNWRGPDGINVPGYLSTPECGRWYVDSDSAMTYDTDRSPARLYPLDGNRYTVGLDPAHEGGDVWATDAALEVMRQEGDDWSGIFVSLPGVDKAAHMWGAIDDPGGPVPMTHVPRATKVADQQVGRIIDQLRDTHQLDNTLVVLTADHGFIPGRRFHGVNDGTEDRGFLNWYYGVSNTSEYLDPQPALQRLVATGNVGLTYSDTMVRAWLKSRTPRDKARAARIMSRLPDSSATWVRAGDHYRLASKVRWGRMGPREERWFRRHAHELVNTGAARYGADVITTLLDNTTYSVAGDHGGIQRNVQRIPIVFAGSSLSGKDLRAPVRSVDIMPTILRAMRIQKTFPMDGHAYRLPRRR